MQYLLSYELNFYRGFPNLKIPSLEILKSLLTFLSQHRNAVNPPPPPQKNFQYITDLLHFSKFEKCDAILHLCKVTGPNLTGQLLWPHLECIR